MSDGETGLTVCLSEWCSDTTCECNFNQKLIGGFCDCDDGAGL